jgi:hypothetical protein
MVRVINRSPALGTRGHRGCCTAGQQGISSAGTRRRVSPQLVPDRQSSRQAFDAAHFACEDVSRSRSRRRAAGLLGRKVRPLSNETRMLWSCSAVVRIVLICLQRRSASLSRESESALGGMGEKNTARWKPLGTPLVGRWNSPLEGCWKGVGSLTAAVPWHSACLPDGYRRGSLKAGPS